VAYDLKLHVETCRKFLLQQGVSGDRIDAIKSRAELMRLMKQANDNLFKVVAKPSCRG
jgi:hypothetical protein